MACEGRCCAAHNSVTCLCRTMHAPCSDRTVTVPSPDYCHALTKTGQQPNKDLTRTVPGLFHRTLNVLSPCCRWTLHGPCMHHALTMLSSNQSRTELAPYCDRAINITALEPCRNWSVQGPRKDHARTVLGPYKDRAVTVLSPCCHHAITALTLNQVKPCFYRQLYAIQTCLWVTGANRSIPVFRECFCRADVRAGTCAKPST